MLFARPVFAIIQRINDMISSEKATVIATAEAKHELRMLIAIVSSLFASIGRLSAEVMLISEARVVSGASLYRKSINWHKSQNTLIFNYHSEISSQTPSLRLKIKPLTPNVEDTKRT